MKAALLRLAGLGLMLFAMAVSLSRLPERPVQTLVDPWGLAPSEFIEIGERVVHVRDEGPLHDRQPLLLLHGVGGSLHDWDDWAAALARTRRVIRLDLPGSGLSDASADDDYRCETDARLVLALLQTLGVAQVRAVGHGRGGEVAARLALLAPQRVQRLLLVASSPLEPEAPPPGLRLAQLVPTPVVPPWVTDALLPRLLVRSTLESLYGDPQRLSEAHYKRRLDLLQRSGNRWALLQQVRQATPEQEGEALFARLRLPVLLLWGTADALHGPAHARALQLAIPGSRLQLLDGLGHLLQEEDPGRSLAAVRGFLDGR